MTPRQTLVLRVLTQAAKNGEPCPTNSTLAELLGASSISCSADIIGQLERLGLIEVQRFQASRIVTIVATGKSTADPGGAKNKHWRARGVVPRPPQHRPRAQAHRDSAGIVVAGPARSDVLADTPQECIPVRECCPKCGTRGDLGCEHREAERRRLSHRDIDGFASVLSLDLSIPEAARRMGWSAHKAELAFERICAELGLEAQ